MKRIWVSFLAVSCLAVLLFLAKGLVAKFETDSGLGGDFSLKTHDNAAMNLKDYRGKIVLLTFGYTHCPDICPANLVRLKQLVKNLGEQGERLQVFFVTIDPERDTPEHLKKYVTFFDPNFLGLTGTLPELEKVTRQYGSGFFKQEEESAGGYLMAHTDYIFLINPAGNLHAYYKTGATLDEMEEAIQSLLDG